MQTKDLAQAIGHEVRGGRGRQGMTRKQLAAAADVSERYLHELESGEANASIGILARIAAALGTDVVSLVKASDGSADGTRPASRLAAFDAVIGGMSLPEQQAVLPIIEQYLTNRRKCLRGVALLGLRGAGKTTLGTMLAKRHKLEFVSVTREIEARAGMSLADLFNLGGPES